MLLDYMAYFRYFKRSPLMNAKQELTKQEKVVLSLVARGWRTSKIAEELYLSPRTVETHLAHIYSKLDVSSRTEATVYAFRTNLTENWEIRRNPDDIPLN